MNEGGEGSEVAGGESGCGGGEEGDDRIGGLVNPAYALQLLCIAVNKRGESHVVTTFYRSVNVGEQRYDGSGASCGSSDLVGQVLFVVCLRPLQKRKMGSRDQQLGKIRVASCGSQRRVIRAISEAKKIVALVSCRLRDQFERRSVDTSQVEVGLLLLVVLEEELAELGRAVDDSEGAVPLSSRVGASLDCLQCLLSVVLSLRWRFSPIITTGDDRY